MGLLSTASRPGIGVGVDPYFKIHQRYSYRNPPLQLSQPAEDALLWLE
ncbi:hypothetical protein [Flavobacterium phycosphaerae]|nr:hypothetical protein [Flavobacterium phycosphaerae]